MTDFDHIPIETTEGHRPPSPTADRLLIGLAVVALTGGLLIAVGNFLGADDGLSIASGSPSPTTAPSRTPRPTASPRPRIEFTVDPGTPTQGSPQPMPFYGWIRARADLVVYRSPELGTPEAGVLAAGAVAYAEEFPEEPATEAGWLHVSAPMPEGWIATVDATGQDLIERFLAPQTQSGAAVWVLVAGDEGFVAIGSASVPSDRPSEQVVMASADGARWRASSSTLPIGWDGGTVAWGPAGWLAVSAMFSAEESGGPWVWQSPDGLSWTALGSMPGLSSDTYPLQLVASERGYLLSTISRSGGVAASLWHSTDGMRWRETADPGMGSQGQTRVAATTIGFYVWDEADGVGRAHAAFSSSGRTWTVVEDGPGGPSLQFASLGDRIVAIDGDPATGSPRVWTGTSARDQLVWLRHPDAEAAFAGALVSKVISDGRRVLAFGVEQSTDDPLTWSLDGGRWTRSDLPAEFSGMVPRLAAGGPRGFVLVGHRPTLRGANPVFWHRTAGESWAPERSPFFDLVPDPTGEECPAPPDDALDFSALDRVAAIACFGDAPITFRAWAAPCEGCFWDDGRREPAWLMGVNEEQLFLSPIAAEHWAGNPAVIHPSLAYDPAWNRQWLDVTGHFDDPAAASCRWMPAPPEMAYYEGRWATVMGCRQQFVVTAVEVVQFPTVPTS